MVCHPKKSSYPPTDSYYGDDSDLIIKSKPIVLEQLGFGVATLELLQDARAVNIDKQRGMLVAKMKGSM